MLETRVVSCGGTSSWSPEEQVARPALVLVRRGRFVRRVDGRTGLADVNTGYVQRTGEVQQIAHPAGADVCTAIGLPDELAGDFPPERPLRVPAAADLLHRRLPRTAEPAELTAELIGALLPAGRPVRGPHPVVEEVRELLHTDPALDLAALAAAVGWSPWHLSRSFHLATGSTLRAYRGRLRVRAALDELAAGGDLAGTAARAGFADQAHMTRVIRAETGLAPGRLRRHLRTSDEPLGRGRLARDG